MILGIGIELLEVPRFRASLARFDARWRARVFTPGEQAYAAARRSGEAQSLAVRFAAKCAARRALAALCRKRPSPLVSGKPETWACAVLYALGQVNYLSDKASTPTMPQVKDALQRQANEFLWHLGDLRKIEKPDDLTKALLKFAESREAREAELREKFLRRDA